jgi:hypothetical protein
MAAKIVCESACVSAHGAVHSLHRNTQPGANNMNTATYWVIFNNDSQQAVPYTSLATAHLMVSLSNAAGKPARIWVA